MQVTNVTVSFTREKQPAQYEKSAPAVGYSAVLSDGENHEAAARELMISATRVVYNGLGYEVPAKVATALASGKVPAELSVATDAADAPENAPLAAETPVEDKPKTRGRPKGSVNTAPKKETKAAEKKRLAAEAEAKDADELAAGAIGDDDAVPGDEPTPNISTGGERVDPNDADGIPGDDDGGDQREEHVEEEEFSPKMLHELMTELIRATPRKLSIINAKQVLAHFKVARAGDLTQEQALEGKAMVDKMVEAFEAQGG